MRAMLIYLPQITEIPYSLAVLSAVFKDNGYTPKALINTFKRPLSNREILEEIERYNPQVIGISMLTLQVLRTYDLIKHLHCKVLVGGTHATACPDEVARTGAIVVRGEGEETLKEILQNKPLSEIQGISYLKDGEVIHNPPRKRIKEFLDPYYEAFDLDLFRLDDGLVKGIHRVFTSRGCPGKCTFCDNRTFGRKVTYLNIDSVLKDIERRIKYYGVKSFVVDDDCFTVNKKHVEAFCRGIKKLGVKWQCEGRVDMITPSLARTLKDSGCYQITFGMESGDPETLLRTQKGTTVGQNIEAARIAHSEGLQVDAYVMFGFPWETVKSLDNTLNMVYELWDEVHLFNGSGSLTPFPGIGLYDQKFGAYWLKPKYQNCGQSLYQNSENPYEASTFYQRVLYDDTYIQEGYFFDYPKDFKKKMYEVAYEIGRHNLESMYPSVLKQKLTLLGCRASKSLYSVFPNLEKGIGKLVHIKKRPSVEVRRFEERGNIN